MNESIIWAVLGLLAGAAISWVLSRSRQRQALAEAAAAALERDGGVLFDFLFNRALQVTAENMSVGMVFV